jgi:hypothetical protein
MKKFLVLFVITLFSINLYSQDVNYRTSLIGNEHNAGVWIPGKIEDKSIEGSPYLFNSSGGLFYIINKKGDKFSLLNLNYNVATKNLEFKISNDSVFQFDKRSIDHVIVAKNKYVMYNNELFLQLSDKDGIQLLKAFKITIQDAVFNPLTQQNSKPKRYLIKSEYKILKDNVLNEFKLNKKSILNLFPDKKDIITQYVNKNKLSYSDEDDVKNIMNYLSNPN